MNTHRTIVRLAVLVGFLIGSAGWSAVAQDAAPSTTGTLAANWQADGTYLLHTDNPLSIQAYYRDVGVGPLILPTRAQWEAMREDCLALGEAWRPLGRVLIPDSKGGDPYPLELCYYSAPNPAWVAEAKCANLGLALRENRTAKHQIVCAPAVASN